MKIREATPLDVIAIVSILESTSEIYSVVDRGRPANIIIIRRNLDRVLRSDTSTVFVAEIGGDGAVGDCAVHWTPFLFLDGGEAYVTELFVRPENRGQGTGSKLLDQVEDDARKRGCSRLSLLNGKMSEAYERGFYKNRNWRERHSMANFILSVKGKPN